jgi:hypothetical protein
MTPPKVGDTLIDFCVTCEENRVCHVTEIDNGGWIVYQCDKCGECTSHPMEMEKETTE